MSQDRYINEDPSPAERKRLEEGNTLAYFWQDKENPERYVGYREAIKMFPEFEAAWLSFKRAKLVVDTMAAGMMEDGRFL